MQGVLKGRQLVVRVLRQSSSPILVNSAHQSSSLCRRYFTPGTIYGDYMQTKCNLHRNGCQCPKYSMMLRASFSTEAAGTIESSLTATESVKDLYDKMLKSIVEQRSAPPNAWLWSLIQSCANHEDVNLLHYILQRLRIFRLSNLRIHENFNCALCQEITRACVRVGAIDLGKKVLWKHNVYGLTPNIGSAHHLLLFAKQNNDVKLLVEIMKLVKRNGLILQPGTADIVLSICSQIDKWDLMCKYGKRFVKAGVKLRKTSLDTWMDFASKIGDVDALWKIEKIRSESMKEHTLASGLSCAKGFLVDHKPEDAAAIIKLLNQTLPNSRKQIFMVELQKLVADWPLEVMKRQKDEKRKEMAAKLQHDIPTMLSALSNLGLNLNPCLSPLMQFWMKGSQLEDYDCVNVWRHEAARVRSTVELWHVILTELMLVTFRFRIRE